MTEQEYIQATNRAKINIALNILRDTLPDEILTDKDRAELVETLYQLYMKYAELEMINEDD